MIMRRREFLEFLGGLAALPPLGALPQQPERLPVIGFLNNASPDTYASFVNAFRQGLRQSGYVEGKSVAIEYRWGRNQSDRLPALAEELVRLPVAIIVASGGDPAVRAAMSATQAIPIVATTGNDPVETGIVASLNRPGGNVTGISVFAVQLVPKRLELARELVPSAPAIAFLVNPDNPNAKIDQQQHAGSCSKGGAAAGDHRRKNRAGMRCRFIFLVWFRGSDQDYARDGALIAMGPSIPALSVTWRRRRLQR
jgi:putative ABC transport system substrate-binding protein